MVSWAAKDKEGLHQIEDSENQITAEWLCNLLNI
jgi:hypothetical protein